MLDSLCLDSDPTSVRSGSSSSDSMDESEETTKLSEKFVYYARGVSDEQLTQKTNL